MTGAFEGEDMEPADRAILLSPPDVGALEEQYVAAAIRSGWVAPAGPDLAAFEREVADRVGVPHAVGLSLGHGRAAPGAGRAGASARATSCPSPRSPSPRPSTRSGTSARSRTSSTPTRPPATSARQLLAEALAELHRPGRRVPAILPVDLLGKVADYDALADGRRMDPGAQ